MRYAYGRSAFSAKLSEPVSVRAARESEIFARIFFFFYFGGLREGVG